MADSQTATPTARPRTPVQDLGEYDGDLPKQERLGYWVRQFEERFKLNPGKVYQYRDVSPTTASNLRKEYGLNAVSQTRDGVVFLYVKWEPEKAEKIKQDVINRGAKRRATVEANKAAAAKAGNSTGKQTAGTRS